MLHLLDPALLAHVVDAVDLVAAAKPTPEPEDVKAGWVALVIWLLMAVAVALLGWSLTRQLRKTNANRDAGVFGDPPVRRDGESDADRRPPTDA